MAAFLQRDKQALHENVVPAPVVVAPGRRPQLRRRVAAAAQALAPGLLQPHRLHRRRLLLPTPADSQPLPARLAAGAGRRPRAFKLPPAPGNIPPPSDPLRPPPVTSCRSLGSFICGWMFLLSLTFSIQDPADGVAGTYQARACCRGARPPMASLHHGHRLPPPPPPPHPPPTHTHACARPPADLQVRLRRPLRQLHRRRRLPDHPLHRQVRRGAQHRRGAGTRCRAGRGRGL